MDVFADSFEVGLPLPNCGELDFSIWQQTKES